MDMDSLKLKIHLALEKTCRKFSSLLSKDATLRILYESVEAQLEFNFRVENLQEKLFIQWGLVLIHQYQYQTGNDKYNGTDILVCNYMGGADGVRRIVDKILIKMEQHVRNVTPRILLPPQFPETENGFKLFLSEEIASPT